jgi:hypothetical protein
MSSLCQNPRVKRHIWQDMLQVAQQEKVLAYIYDR